MLTSALHSGNFSLRFKISGERGVMKIKGEV